MHDDSNGCMEMVPSVVKLPFRVSRLHADVTVAQRDVLALRVFRFYPHHASIEHLQPLLKQQCPFWDSCQVYGWFGRW